MARTIPRGWQELEIKDFLKFTSRDVEKPRAQYRALGIRSHCKGTFVREVENPDKVMMETLYEVKKDDLIVNITFAWEGAVALVKERDEGALVSHRFPTYVFDRDVVVPEFFQYLIPSKRFVYNLGIISPGGAGRNRVLDRKDFQHLQFIMPPVEEQKKIAEILSVWDRAIETLDKLIESKTRLKKGLMQKLLKGHVRLKRFATAGGLKRTKIGAIPIDWEVIKIGVVADVKGGSGFPEVYQGKKEGAYPFIKVSDMSNDGNEKYISKANNYIDQGEKESLRVNIFPPNTVVFAKVGAALLLNRRRILTRESAIDNNMMGATPRTNIDSEFMYQQFLQIDFGKHFQQTALPSINQAQVNSLMISYPSLEEQRGIGAFLNLLEEEKRSLGEIRVRVVNQKKALMQKLLTGKIRVKI